MKSKGNKSLIAGLTLTGASLLSGCLSYTCSTVKCDQPLLPASSVRYYVRSFKLLPAATVYPFGSYPENKRNGNLRASTIRAAFARHTPEVFTEQKEGAVPIDVSVDVLRTGSTGLDSLTAFLCGFTYGILPGRLSNNLDVTVSVKIADGFAEKGDWKVFAYDDRAEYVMMFYSPVNLILAPVSEKFNGCRTFGGDTYDWYPTKQLGDIVQAALAHFDQGKLKKALENQQKSTEEQPTAKAPPVVQPSAAAPVRNAQPVRNATPNAAKPAEISAEDIPL